MKIVVIIQARMGSTRLPGKVLKKIEQKTVLEHVIARVQRAEGIAGIVVAIPLGTQDDELLQHIQALGVSYFRGSQTDVLERYYQAAKSYQADAVVRVTADCPLLDPNLLTAMLQEFTRQIANKVDYLSNCLTRQYPRGLDIEILTMAALTSAYELAHQDYEREHVTPYIYQNPDRFTLYSFSAQEDLSQLRWTLDTPEDLAFIQAVYASLYHENPQFSTQDILQLMKEKPHLLKINNHIQQKELSYGSAQ